jgi:hypothetical protein
VERITDFKYSEYLSIKAAGNKSKEGKHCKEGHVRKVALSGACPEHFRKPGFE